MEEKKENFIQRHKMGVFVTVSAVVMLIGLSYAWLQLTLRGTKDLTIHAGSLSLVLDDSMEGGVTMASAVPVIDAEGKAQDGYTFTLENNGQIGSDYTIYLDDLTLDEGQTKMKDEFIKISLTKEGQEETILLSQTLVDGKRVLDLGNIASGATYTYNLKMWIDANAGNEVMGTVFKGQLRIEGVQDVKQTKNLAIQPNAANLTYEAATDDEKKEMFAFSHNPGRQQVGYSKDELTDYRYIGTNPNNYVTFNDEVWRIIGIFTVEDENGKKEQRMKLIRNESIGAYSFDNKPSGEGSSDSAYGSSDWTDSRLKEVLNSGAYYNRTSGTCPNGQNNATTACDFSSNGLTDTAKSMIGKTKWYLGGHNSYNTTNALETYKYERETLTAKTERNTSWIGEVGLIYPSDYGYAASGSDCLNTNLYDYNSSCMNIDWLFNSKYQWTLTSRSGRSYDVFLISLSGSVGYNDSYFIRGVRPSVYLKSNVKIASGDGSSTNPYTLTE